MPETPTDTQPLTPGQRLAVTLYALHSETGEKLEDDVARWITEGMSWRRMTEVIATFTNGEVSVSHESLRTWYGHLQTGSVA